MSARAPALICSTMIAMILMVGSLCPTAAHAAVGELRLSLEPGIGTLQRQQDQRAWGGLGGASLAVGIGDLLWVEAHIDYGSFAFSRPRLSVLTAGAALVYNIDVLPVTPFVQVGLAYARLAYASPAAARRQPALPSQIVPVLGLGLSAPILSWLRWGVVVRYYPLFASSLLTEPAYTTVQARLSLDWLRRGAGAKSSHGL